MLLFLILFINTCFSGRTLIQVQVLTRHGNKMPPDTVKEFPNCPVDLFEMWGLGAQDLTEIGEEQSYDVGMAIREEYMTEGGEFYIEGIPEEYNENDFLFYSSERERTFETSRFVKRGIFSDDDPEVVDEIPVFIFADEPHDLVLVEPFACPVWETLTTPHFDRPQVVEYYDLKYMNELNELTGLDIHMSRDSQDTSMLMATLVEAGLLCEELIPYIPFADFVAEVFYRVRFSTEYNPSFVGRGILDAFLGFMEERIEEEDGPKFVHMSGHMSTIFGFFMSVALVKDYPDIITPIPAHAASIYLELWRDDDEEDKYYVELLYQNPHDNEVLDSLYMGTFGCDDYACDYDIFREKAIEYIEATSVDDIIDICEAAAEVMGRPIDLEGFV